MRAGIKKQKSTSTKPNYTGLGLLHTWKQKRSQQSLVSSKFNSEPRQTDNALWPLSVSQLRQILSNIGSKLTQTSLAAKSLPLIINQTYEQNRLIRECEMFYQDMSEMVLKLQQQSKLWKKYATSEDYELLLWEIDELGKLIEEFASGVTRFDSLGDALQGQLADLIGNLQHQYEWPRAELAGSKIRSSLHKTMVMELVEKQEQSRIKILSFIRRLKQP